MFGIYFVKYFYLSTKVYDPYDGLICRPYTHARRRLAYVLENFVTEFSNKVIDEMLPKICNVTQIHNDRGQRVW
jgi:hypothetical protein